MLYSNTQLKVKKKQTNITADSKVTTSKQKKKKKKTDLINSKKLIYCTYACVHMIHKYFQQIVKILNVWKLVEIKMNNRKGNKILDLLLHRSKKQIA